MVDDSQNKLRSELISLVEKLDHRNCPSWYKVVGSDEQSFGNLIGNNGSDRLEHTKRILAKCGFLVHNKWVFSEQAFEKAYNRLCPNQSIKLKFEKEASREKAYWVLIGSNGIDPAPTLKEQITNTKRNNRRSGMITFATSFITNKKYLRRKNMQEQRQASTYIRRRRAHLVQPSCALDMTSPPFNVASGVTVSLERFTRMQ
jgi:hypothetical protein